MEQFPRFKSAPQLLKVDDNTYVLVDPSTPTDEEYTEEDEEDMSEVEGAKSTDGETRSVSGESSHMTHLLPDKSAYMSESDASPILSRKKRRAPLPPNMRHTYAFDSNTIHLRNSTDSESTTSESKLMYQTSTESDTVISPESARGSNFAGELAGLENIKSYPKLISFPEDPSLIETPRGKSKLIRLREVFRSPQIHRRKAAKTKGIAERNQWIKKFRIENGGTPTSKRSKVEEGTKSHRTKYLGNLEPIPDISDWNIALGYRDLIADHEFEVKRVEDYEEFFSRLLEETDSTSPDYSEYVRAWEKLVSIRKDRENELGLNEPPSMEVVHEDSAEAGDSPTAANDDSFDRSLISNDGNVVDTSSVQLILNNNNIIDSSNTSGLTNVNIATQNYEDNDKHWNKRRGLSLRRRSAPSVILFRPQAGSKSKTNSSLWSGVGLSKQHVDIIEQLKMADGGNSRVFVMEGPVQFAAGMQIQDRYLFLFSDLLLVTKQKSSTTFKLKHRVKLSDMWIASCLEEVSETTRPTDRSFVLGWPTTNFVATFHRVDLKDEWLTSLCANIAKEQMKDEDKSLDLRVAVIESTSCRTRQMSITNVTQVKDVVRTCLNQINIPENEVCNYQLWVLTGKDGSAYPLIGHETPFSIKLSQTRLLTRSQSGNDLDNMTAADLDPSVENSSPIRQKCEFYLKHKQASGKNTFDDSTLPKSAKKNKKSPNILKTIIHKIRPARSQVFGQPLSEVCGEDLDPPGEIIKLMVLVYQQGPHTPGILRRGNKAALGKEIREKIDSGDRYPLEDNMAPTAASVFKEFLRCIPDGLLMNNLHEQWLAVKKDDPHGEKISKIKIILSKLAPAHYHMVKLTICLLQHLAKHSSENHMGPSNLATCIAPSFYASNVCDSPQGKYKGDALKQQQMENSFSEIQNIIVPLISFMIINHVELFGEDILVMFVKYGCSPSPMMSLDEDRYDNQIQAFAEEDEDDIAGEEEDDDNFDDQHSKTLQRLRVQQRHQRDSGTDSDSMHSVLSMQDTGMGLQQDNSSIDSLAERDYFSHEVEAGQQINKSHLSPSNLSRDSGLTLSDNQLYDDEFLPDFAAATAKINQEKITQCGASHGANFYGCFDQNAEGPNSTNANPVPPPRKRSVKRRVCKDAGNREQSAFTLYPSQDTLLKHSASATQISDKDTTSKQKDLKLKIMHSTLDKRASLDLAAEANRGNQTHPLDFQRMKERTDIGTLVKSESGTQLYLNEETSPSKFPLGTQNRPEHQYTRQSSTTNSSAQMSPQSRHSQCSYDSVISDSSCGFSQGSSTNSTPQTPDESQEEFMTWIHDFNLPGKPWEALFTNSPSNQQSNSFSKPENNLHFVDSVDHARPDWDLQLTPLKLGAEKIHKSEEAEINKPSHFSLLNKPNDSSTDVSSDSSKTFPSIDPSQGNHTFQDQPVTDSPPLSIVLQKMQTVSRRDSLTLPVDCERSGGTQIRRSSLDSYEQRHVGTSKCAQPVQCKEQLSTKSKPKIISPDDSSSSSASSASSRAKLSKYISPGILLPSSKERGIAVPNSSSEGTPDCQPRAQRNVKMECKIFDDPIIQRENSMRARAMYEKSQRIYNENLTSPHTKQASDQLISPNPDSVAAPKTGSMSGKTETSAVCRRKFVDHLNTRNGPRDSCLSDTSSDTSKNEVPGLDSGSKHKDVYHRRSVHEDRDTSPLGRHLRAGVFVSLSRNDSRLSDSGSSSSGSATTSTLSKSPDPIEHHTDLGNSNSATVSSVTSSESSSEITPTHMRAESGIRTGQRSGQNETGKSTKTELFADSVSDKAHDVPSTVERDFKQLSLGSAQTQNLSSAIPSNQSSSLSSNMSHLQKQATDNVSKPHLQTSSSDVQKTNPSRGRSTESKASSSLTVPNVNLHRSRSDSSEHVHKLPQVNKSRPDVPKSDKQIHRSSSNAHLAGAKDAKMQSLPREAKSEYQLNFLKARSYFHQSQDDKLPHVTNSHHSPAESRRSSSSSSSSHDGGGQRSLQHKPAAPMPQDIAGEASSSSVTKSEVLSKVVNQATNSSVREQKSDFPWSVRNLKSIYNKDVPGSP